MIGKKLKVVNTKFDMWCKMKDRGFNWWLAHEMGLELDAIAELEKADIGEVIWSVVEVGEPYGVMFVAAG